MAAINATLFATSGLTYTPTIGFNGSDSLSLSVSDTLGNSKTAAVPITAIGPLTITSPLTSQLVKANGTLGVNSISLTDPSLPTSDNVTLNLAVADGTVTLSTSIASGITSSQVTGNGTGSVAITAPLAAINATLAANGGLIYAPAAGFSGADTLSLTGSDMQGNSGTGNVPLVVAGPPTVTVPSTARS